MPGPATGVTVFIANAYWLMMRFIGPNKHIEWMLFCVSQLRMYCSVAFASSIPFITHLYGHLTPRAQPNPHKHTVYPILID